MCNQKISFQFSINHLVIYLFVFLHPLLKYLFNSYPLRDMYLAEEGRTVSAFMQLMI